MTETTLLQTIDSPADLRKLPVEKLSDVAREIRSYIIECVSHTGGHLSSSLGSVELALALHYVFNTPDDRLVWDVGHQAYAHKILTGRREGLKRVRQYKGLSGFPRRNEASGQGQLCRCRYRGRSFNGRYGKRGVKPCR